MEIEAARCGWASRDGISRFDPATDSFVNYRPVPENPASLANTVWVIYQDRSGALWAGTWGGVLIRFDEKTKAFVSYAPDSRDPRQTQRRGHQHHPRRPDRDIVGGSVRRTVPARPPKRSVRPLHGKRGPAQQQHSLHSGRSDSAGSGSALRRAYPGSILGGERLETTTCPMDLQSNEFSDRLFSGRGWGDVLWRQQWIQRICP